MTEISRASPTNQDQDPLRALLAASITGLVSGGLVVLINDVVHLGRAVFDKLPAPASSFGPAMSATLVALLSLATPLHGQGADLQSLKAAGGWPTADKCMAPLRGVAAALTLAGGNSLGPEGPSVEIGANVGAGIGASMLSSRPRLDTVTKFAGTTASKLQWNLLAAGCASGIAAGFNAPIAGLFYSLEALGNSPGGVEGKTAKADDGMKALGPSMQLLAAVLAATVSQLGLGSTPAVDLEKVMWAPRESLWELPLFLLLGACCGLCAAALANAVKEARQGINWLQRRGVPSWVFPPVAGLLVSAACFAGTSEVVYRGFDNVNYVLQQVDGVVPPATKTRPLEHLFWLLVTKAALTAVCQASGLVGGLFAPALFLGVSLGGIFGRGLRDNAWSWPLMLGDTHAFSVPATYSIVGMAATLASVCRAPLTAVVLIIELTGGSDYGVVLPTVAAVGTAVYIENRVAVWLNRDIMDPSHAVNMSAEKEHGPRSPGSWVYDPKMARLEMQSQDIEIRGSEQPPVVHMDPNSSVAELLQHLRSMQQANPGSTSDVVTVVVGGTDDETATVAFMSKESTEGSIAKPTP